ncbi:hypothetical protein OFB51_24225, partial [Escherichia coli]|nr:hypothetical protein [Escherichia coli]
TGGAVLIGVFWGGAVVVRVVELTRAVTVAVAAEGAGITFGESGSVIVISYILASYFNNLVVY